MKCNNRNQHIVNNTENHPVCQSLNFSTLIVWFIIIILLPLDISNSSVLTQVLCHSHLYPQGPVGVLMD